MATQAEIVSSMLDNCPACGIALPPPKPTARNFVVAKGLLDPSVTKTQALAKAGYSPATIDSNSGAIAGSQGVRLALTSLQKRSLDKATRLERQAERFGAKLEDAAAMADPLQAVQIYGALIKLAQEERRISGTERDQLTMADRLASLHLGRRRMARVLRYALRNKEGAARLVAALEGAL